MRTLKEDEEEDETYHIASLVDDATRHPDRKGTRDHTTFFDACLVSTVMKSTQSTKHCVRCPHKHAYAYAA